MTGSGDAPVVQPPDHPLTMPRLIARLLAAALPLAPLAATAQQSPNALPPAMHGTWGYEPRSCTDETDDGRVKVEPRAVEFFAAACRFTRIRTGPDNALTASGRCRGEGETGVDQGAIRFRQVSRDRLEISLQGSTHVYQRCERALPVR
ncbi:hypothetical protein [Phreatobacter sp.]|uniref:hypothetical protein n=1 Tax=Phreatobacter sp. TaxID=1966341 RepID=UPI003F7091E5